MSKERRHTVHLFSALLVLLFVAVAIQAGGTDDVLSRLVKITTTKGSRYQLLRQVSDQTGYYFIYDSQVINNDEEVKIRKENIAAANVTEASANAQKAVELWNQEMLNTKYLNDTQEERVDIVTGKQKEPNKTRS